MSRRKSPEKLVRISMNLIERDYEKMKALYPDVGATVAIRALVHAHVAKVEAKTAALLDTTLIDDLEIELDDGII